MRNLVLLAERRITVPISSEQQLPGCAIISNGGGGDDDDDDEDDDDTRGSGGGASKEYHDGTKLQRLRMLRRLHLLRRLRRRRRGRRADESIVCSMARDPTLPDSVGYEHDEHDEDDHDFCEHDEEKDDLSAEAAAAQRSQVRSKTRKRRPTTFLLTPRGRLVATYSRGDGGEDDDGVCWSIDLEDVILDAAGDDDDDDDDHEDDDHDHDEGQSQQDRVSSLQRRRRKLLATVERTRKMTRLRRGWFDVSYVRGGVGSGTGAGTAIEGVSSPYKLVCLSHSGSVVSVDPLTGSSELVGTFDHGIAAGRWSADGDVLALYTYVPEEDEDDEEEEYGDGEDDEKDEQGVKSFSTDSEKKKEKEEDLASVLMTMNSDFEVLVEVRVERSVRPASVVDAVAFAKAVADADADADADDEEEGSDDIGEQGERGDDVVDDDDDDDDDDDIDAPERDEAAVSLCWKATESDAIAVSALDESFSSFSSSLSSTLPSSKSTSPAQRGTIRRVRIYSVSDLSLQSVGRSEDGSGKDVPNLMPVSCSCAGSSSSLSGLAWSGRGCSNLLASVQGGKVLNVKRGNNDSNNRNKYRLVPKKIVFFEPNGLRHRDFKLRLGEEEDDINVDGRRGAGRWTTEDVTGIAWDDVGCCGVGDEGGTLAVAWRCEREVPLKSSSKANTNHNSEEADADTEVEVEVEGRIQLWRRSNYHWYMKREFRYRNRDVTVIRFEKGDEEGFGSGVEGLGGGGERGEAVGAQGNGRFRNLTVALAPAVSASASVHVNGNVGNDDDDIPPSLEYREYALLWDASSVCAGTGTAASIDGTSIYITPLAKAIIPPPMYASEIRLSRPANEAVPVPFRFYAPSSSSSCVSRAFDSDRQMSAAGGEGGGGGGEGSASGSEEREGVVVEWLAHMADGSVAFLGKAGKGGGSGSGSGGTSVRVPGYDPPVLLTRLDLSSASAPCDGVAGEGKELEFDPTAVRNLSIADVRYSSRDGGGGVVIRLVGVLCAAVGERGERLVEIDVRLGGGGSGGGGGGETGVRALLEEARTLDVGGRSAAVLRMAPWSDPPLHDDDGNDDDYAKANRDEDEEGRGRQVTGLIVELDDGTLLEYDRTGPARHGAAGGGCLTPSSAEPLLEPCPWIAALRRPERFIVADADADGQTRGNGRAVVVGLSARSRLYLSDRLLSSSSSSFALSTRHSFLVHVTVGSRPQLRFLSLSALASHDPLFGSEGDAERLGDGYEPRDVERGSRIVAVLPSDPGVVLQMPRGNLEGVYPRALVLPHAMRLLEGREYGRAVELMRRQKVDLNLVVDIDPDAFLEGGGVEQLVDQVCGVDRLNLFLSNLSDEDITRWKYRVPSWVCRAVVGGEGSAGSKNGLFDFATKVNRVCSAMRGAMLHAEEGGATSSGRAVAAGHFLLPILSSFAKERPPRLVDALTRIRENAYRAVGSGGPSRKSPLLTDRAQSSIQYLAFLADYKLLFDTALGMYDYDLAKAVARNSPQMDPKVYLPLLKRLRGLPDHTAKYEVDVRLGRYESALRNLVLMETEAAASGANGSDAYGTADDDPAATTTSDNVENDDWSERHFERCLAFIARHKLHKLGLELYEQSQPERRRRVAVSLGERLLVEGRGDVALSVFLAAEPPEMDGARRAARLCGDWRAYFYCASLSSICRDGGVEGDGMSAGRRRAVAAEIADEIASGRMTSANRGEGEYSFQSKREGAACAARILLDYAGDVVGAVDMFVQAEMWSEGRRIALLRSRADLVRRVVDGAVSSAHAYLEDMSSRVDTFCEANARYADVVKIRREAVRSGGEHVAGDYIPDGAPGDDGSLFSLASQATDASIRSDFSGSSVGSVTSVSTVISAGAVSTFSITGDSDVNKHRSKFNKISKKKKKKKVTRRSKRTMAPGSEEELKSLVGTLKASCVDMVFAQAVADTIQFLAQVQKIALARELYDGYHNMREKIMDSQDKRKTSEKEEKLETERCAQRDGHHFQEVELWCEKDIDGLCCPQFPGIMQEVFSYL